ncbi:hypothetical protein H072_6440 [Dactylellina haptotyla CBS 200.50]|uniref:DUF7918 domain-containing protein n=1 Tax=Dactylellina haptotyla (strain CBS 200.50) TaxID=1284197 RepID=S8AA21_DACHA|nr:hypothetical protein H072_6440 [Dactylellina haptotyla CBS 200.50]
MVLKSRNLQVWIEKPTGSFCPKTHTSIQEKSTSFSHLKSTQKILPGHPLLVNEAYVETSPEGSPYSVVVRIPPHWRNMGVQLIIDGVEQGSFMRFNRFKSYETRITGRRVERTTMRGFQFSKLRIEDGHGNYDFDDKAHCKGGYIANQIKRNEIKPIEFMIGKKAVGIIRVNVYRVGKIVPGGEFKGNGNWTPCTVVDDIGALKMQNTVESITTLGKPTRCQPTKVVYAEFPDRYPFETFVLKYRSHEALAADNLLVVKHSPFRKLVSYITNWFKLRARVQVGYSEKLKV